jgi:hypothetical protein
MAKPVYQTPGYDPLKAHERYEAKKAENLNQNGIETVRELAEETREKFITLLKEAKTKGILNKKKIHAVQTVLSDLRLRADEQVNEVKEVADVEVKPS